MNTNSSFVRFCQSDLVSPICSIVDLVVVDLYLF